MNAFERLIYMLGCVAFAAIFMYVVWLFIGMVTPGDVPSSLKDASKLFMSFGGAVVGAAFGALYEPPMKATRAES